MKATPIYEAEALRKLQRFVRSPKGLLLIILSAFVVIATPFVGSGQIWTNVVASMFVAALLDVSIVMALYDRWDLPDGAMLTGMIVAMVLRPQEPLLVVLAIVAMAIMAKHLLRTRWSNVFNPAALALVIGALVFNAQESWWGALPDVTVLGLLAIAAAGGFMADRINKLPLVAVFLGAYFGLFTLDSFMGQPMAVSEIFRTPDLQAALFFAFFMLDDPPTCPIRYEDQIVFGVIVAATSFVVFKLLGVDYYLATGLLAGNAWESARRAWAHSASRVARPHPHQTPARPASRPATPQTSSWARPPTAGSVPLHGSGRERR